MSTFTLNRFSLLHTGLNQNDVTIIHFFGTHNLLSVLPDFKPQNTEEETTGRICHSGCNAINVQIYTNQQTEDRLIIN
jgi:hypothetical protein